MNVLGIPLVDPEDGSPLRADSPHSLVGDGEKRRPVVAGIPFLRTGRDRLRMAALVALDEGDEREALALLLADQDDYARTPPPGPGAVARLVEAVDGGSATLRDAMAALEYGPVADYFAYRWSAPTYLSGLALLERHNLDGAAVVEVACGIGHYLRDLASRGVACAGVDVVFSKLWLARKFVVPADVPLTCADVSTGWPFGPAPGPTLAFCQDAFYFLPDKPAVVASLRRTVGDEGRILIGHAHNSRRDQRGVAGEPLTPDEYAALLPGCILYDDAELARSAWSGSSAAPRDTSELAEVEAVALAWGGDGSGDPRLKLTTAPADRPLRLNPMLVEEAGFLRPHWPSATFKAEYAADSPYLLDEPSPRIKVRSEDPAEFDRLTRRRILLDLPERW